MDRRDQQEFGTPGTSGYPLSAGYYDYYDDDHLYDQDRGGNNWLWITAGTLLAAAGGYLIYQGMSSRGGEGMGRGAERVMGRGRAIRVKKATTVNKPVSEIYGFWRNLENLPLIMTHLESVQSLGGGRSHWIAKGPAGTKVEWDAEIVEDRANELISWRSVEGSDVPNEGVVRFRDRGDSTEIQVSLTYHPPGGALGAGVARLFGEEPSQQITEDLRKFKQKIETGEIATSAYGQSAERLGGSTGL